MPDAKTPKWLIDTQNKSWEPEILISGIILTFLFLLSNYIYNFYGMLIQELNVRYVVGRNIYVVSIIILNGLKIGLIFHLILRGIWTGFVGLSYVFPDGVNKQNMPESKRKINFHKPEIFVIRLEKVCSLLFSFIFSSIIFVGSFCIGMIPFALLFIAGFDISTIRVVILYIIIPLYIILGIIWIVLANRKKKSKIVDSAENSILSNILTTYFTNMGKIKTFLLFVLYFTIISLLSLSEIFEFDFKNESNADKTIKSTIIQLNKDHYKNTRDKSLRISKAAIDQFWIEDNSIELFISFYKEDLYTIQNLTEKPASLKSLDILTDSTGIDLKSLYHIYMDDKMISGLRWYGIQNENSNQKGIITKIAVDCLERGYHEIKIDKIFWIDKNKKPQLIENWDVIPFEVDKAILDDDS